jgi:hypothetical protein
MISIDSLKYVVLVLSFLSFNLSPLARVDYFPLLFMLIPFVFGYTNLKVIIFFLLAIFFSIYISLNFDFQSLIQIYVFLYFLCFLGVVSKDLLLLNNCVRVLFYIHFIYLIFWIFEPNLSSILFGARGGGRNPFFYSEPSYAAISIVGLYLLYIITNKPNASGAIYYTFWYGLLAILMLISTLSFTGYIFILFILFYLFLSASFKMKAVLLIATIAQYYFFQLDSFGRADFFRDVNLFHDFFYFINIYDASAAWRMNLNFISFFYALDNPFGGSRFYTDADLVSLPLKYNFMLDNEIFGINTLIKGQSLVSSFLLAFGFVGLLFLVVIFVLTNIGYLSFINQNGASYKVVILINLFLLYSFFVQSSLTSPVLLMILSIGLYQLRFFNRRFQV